MKPYRADLKHAMSVPALRKRFQDTTNRSMIVKAWVIEREDCDMSLPQNILRSERGGRFGVCQRGVAQVRQGTRCLSLRSMPWIGQPARSLHGARSPS